jgi:lycopene beta-cyclase
VKRYDFIIVGGGAAGLSLACHMARTPLRERSILVVDRSPAGHSHHIWAFWTDRPTLFDPIICRSWDRLQVSSEKRNRLLDLGRYRYKVIRGADFHRFAHETLSRYPNVEFVRGNVERIEDGTGGATIMVGEEEYTGSWVFDSRFRLAAFRPDPRRYRYLKMQFLGWEIETEGAHFDPGRPIFLDFRTSQGGCLPGGDMRFMYVLPYSPREALVEHVACADNMLEQLDAAEQQRALESYIHDELCVGQYRIVAREHGVSPMTDYTFPRRTGRHIMSIGVPAGMLKPATGFAFMRIQRDSAAIVRSVVRHGHPFEVPRPRSIYRLCDSLLLYGMSRHGRRMGSVLSALFKYGSAERILGFLDERGAPI